MQLERWKQGNPEIQSEKASQILGVIRTCNYFFHISHAYRNMVQLHFPASVKLGMAMYLHQWSVRKTVSVTPGQKFLKISTVFFMNPFLPWQL